MRISFTRYFDKASGKEFKIIEKKNSSISNLENEEEK